MTRVAAADTRGSSARVGLDIPPADAGVPVVRIDADTLADALETECRLLGQLCVVLRRQRSSQDNGAAMEESLVAMHRVTRTLAEAQRHRTTILGLLTASESTPLQDLEHALGRRMNARLTAVRDRVLRSTREVAREIEVNKLVFRAWSRR